VTAHKPRGAFYTIARLPVIDSEAFASFMLRDFADQGETVFVAPAGGFYMDKSRGLNEIRLAYVLAPQKISRAIDILQVGLATYCRSVAAA
jgi:aspartate aminotransferase